MSHLSRKCLALLGAASLATASPPDPMRLWQVTPEIDYSDPLYAGWDQIPVVKEIEIYNGVAENRTYAHHPELFAIGDTAYLIFSSAPVDEDSMGQDVWISTSQDGGLTWSESESLIPAALLPNQTDPEPYNYYCDRGIAQRAWQALTFVPLINSDGSTELYAIGQSGTRWCPAKFRTAGRVARRVTLDGKPDGDPCWLRQNDLTEAQLFNETVYGTEYGMRFCERACEINEILNRPDQAPAWSTWLYNHELYAADDEHTMQEQTHAVWFDDADSPTGGYWQRFWRDVSGSAINALAVWVEYNEDRAGRGWYPKRLSQHGNQIHQTNMPDDKTKQYFGQLADGDRYFLSNSKYNDTVKERQPLTLAMSRGANLAFTGIGVLRTNASNDIVPDTRGGVKDHAHGFSYPTAVQIGDRLLAAYSENKENIWVSVVDVKDLPS